MHGAIVVEGEPFSEGEKVTVLSSGDSRPFRVSADEKRMLLESMAEADRGELVDGDDLLAELDESPAGRRRSAGEDAGGPCD